MRGSTSSSRLCRRALVALATVAGLCCRPTETSAAERRVVVAAPPGDALGDLFEKELTALDIRADRVDGAEHCNRSLVRLRIEEKSAWVGACSDGGVIRIFTRDGDAGMRFHQAVAASSDEPTGRAAARAAEISRAILEHGGGGDDIPSSTWVDYPADADRAPTKAAAPARERLPRVLAAMGVSSFAGSGTTAPAISGQIGLRASRWLFASLRFDSAFGDGVANRNLGFYTPAARPTLIAAQLDLPILDQSARLVPRVGGGLGLMVLHASADQISSARSELFATAAGHLDVGLSLHVVGPVRLGAEALIGATAQRMIVSVRRQDMVDWGQPFGLVAGRVEVAFQ